MKIKWGFVFDWGFRPFFLLGSFHIVAALIYWVLALKGLAPLPDAIPSNDWHAHELIFGFGSAAFAGFLLTAVPSWTTSTHVHGRQLQILVGLWIAGRVGVAFADFLSLALVVSINLFFTFYLGWLVIKPLWRHEENRHRVIAFVWSLFIVTQGMVYVGWFRLDDDFELSRVALYGALYALIYGIVVITTRISVVVVRQALDEQKDTVSVFLPYPYRRNLAATTFLLFALADMFIPETPILGWCAVAAAAAQFDRLSDFHVGRVLLKPYVLLIYTANLWIGLGCLGMGVNAFYELGEAWTVRHIFAIGAAATAILSVFTIAGLRHSGLDLVVPKRVVTALGLIFLGTSVRTIPAFFNNLLSYEASLDISAFLVALAYLLYITYFVKILTEE